MANPSSYADHVVDIEKLLAAVSANADKLSNLDALLAPLQQTLADLKALTTRRNTHTADKQVLNTQLSTLLSQGRRQSTTLRAAVRGQIGPFEEKLTEFRVAPLRARPRKAKAKGKKKTPTPEPEAPQPATPPTTTG